MQVKLKHSRGTWKVGKGWGAVVTDSGEGFPVGTGHDDKDYYSGYLICESVAKSADANLITAAPDLLQAAMMATGIIQKAPIPFTRAEINKALRDAIAKAIAVDVDTLTDKEEEIIQDENKLNK